MKKKFVSLLLVLSMLASFVAGCGQEDTSVSQVSVSQSLQGESENEILTTTAVDQDKTMITVRVENGVGQQDNFEQILEEKFPNVDIVLRHDGSASSVYTMRASLESGEECDLILSRTLPYTADIASQYLLDLSAEPFVDNYYMNAVDSCANSDGELYYLPGPSDVYGIVYDKTMFDEYGWELPSSYSEFVALLDAIRQTTAEAGEEVEPFTVSLMYPDMMQILFNTYGYDDVYSGTDNFQWLTAYQQGEGSMVGHMESAVKDFKKLFEDGVLSLDATETEPSTRSEMMYVDHSTAMIIECQNAVNYVKAMTEGVDTEVHELAMMPFWTSDEEDSDYLYAIPEYYLAVSKRAAQESEEKKEILLDIMEYLSSVEGQNMLMGDDFVLSNIEGVEMNANSFSENIIDTVERGQVINTFYLAAGENSKQVERAMLAQVPDLINENISVKEFLTTADEARDAWLAGTAEETSYGTVETTLTRLETAYTMAEMYADVMGTSIGICEGGGWNRSTNGYLYEGAITDQMLEALTPNKETQADDANPDGDKIVTASLTGQQILDVLNDATQITDTSGLSPYYVAYGLTVEFAPWASGGERVISCKTSDGKEIDPKEVYEVAYFNGSLPLSGIEPEQVCDQEWTEAFTSWLTGQGGTVKEPEMTLTLVYNQ
jgi:ABC-type glycerol-3-phosphate transport system substrate-binding protein